MMRIPFTLLYTIPFIGFGSYGLIETKDVSQLDSVYNQEKYTITVNCTKENYMSKNNIHPENYHENRRELKTTLSKSDFDVAYDKFGISCSELLVKHLYCNICFNSDENILTSYDGRKFKFKKNISSIEITTKCLGLISSMTMGSNEYSEFLKNQK